MELKDYIRSKRHIKSMSGIRERWEGRIVKPNGWHLQGEAGAAKYIVQYGKTIKVPKLLALAQYAGERGYFDMANGFYMYAARMEGVTIDRHLPSSFNVLAHRIQKMPPIAVAGVYYDFPQLLQPGTVKVETNSVAFVTAKETFYQYPNDKDLYVTLEFRVDEQLRILALALGSLIVTFELAWVDFAGLEYATAQESIDANSVLGFDTLLPEPIMTIVSCLYCKNAQAGIADIANLVGKEFVRVRSVEYA